MEAAWLLALIVTPLFFNVYSSRVFEPDKIALLRSLALIAAAAWLVKLSAEGGLRFESKENSSPLGVFFRQPLVLPVTALVVVYLLSTLLSVSSYASLLGSYQRMQGTFTTFSYLVLFAAIVGNLRRRAQAERLLTTVIVTALPIAFYGILQRYRQDPLPWGGDTTERVTANMGNAIFVAAYLIMAALVTLGRVVVTFHAILTTTENFLRNMLRATGYVFILALDLVAIWFSQSRGPWLGLLAGLFFFFVLLSLQWHIRPLTLSAIGLAALLGVFLIVLNIPNGPLERVRAIPGIGRLGSVFETEGGTGKVRVLIWEGVVKLMTPHPPLEYPDGRSDPWNAIRPLIGYGPESLYVAFNRFYPPDLAHYEARNATPDRSHNETFDALAFTGLLGLGVYLALFVALFYYGLKWLGLVGTPFRRNVLLGLVLGGGLASAAGFVIWRGPEFFGVGLPLGMLVGLIIYLTLFALRGISKTAEAGRADSSDIPERWRAVAMISLFSAIVAHFAEIHFGIAIVSTRTHFWVFAGALTVLGYLIPAAQTAPATAAAAAPNSAAVPPRRRQRAAGARNIAGADSARERGGAAAVSAGVMTAILFTLGFDFVTNPTHVEQFDRIIVEALTVNPKEGNAAAYGILLMVLLTWLIGGLLLYLEETHNARGPLRPETVAGSLLLNLLLGGLCWLVLSGYLASIAGFRPASVEQLVDSTLVVAGVLDLFYALGLVLLLGLAAVLPAAQGTQRSAFSRPLSPMTFLWMVLLPLTALVLSTAYNLQLIKADIVYKTGLQFDDQGQSPYSIDIYNKAIALTPGQDYYYLFLGRAYLNTTSSITDTVQQTNLLAKAESELIKARDLNPLNTDHSANLGRLNRQWALFAADPNIRADKAQRADEYYRQALSLSPNNVGLWNEWASLHFQLLGDLDAAQAKLDQSLALDREFDQTYQIQGDLYATRAQRASDPAAQKDYYQQAIDALNQGVEVVKTRSGNPLQLRLSLAGAYVATQQIQPAIDEYLQVAQIGLGPDQWKVYQAIAQLYWQQGQAPQARAYGQQALDAAPDNEKPGVTAWLATLPATP